MIPISVTHPTRKPFSGGYRFVDGKGPPPYEFFDEAQDHISALMHAKLGWQYAMDREDFDNEVYPSNFLGKLRITRNGPGVGVTLSTLTPTNQGEHGVWKGLSGALAAYEFEMQSNSLYVSAHDPYTPHTGDLLVSAKVLCLNRAHLHVVDSFGFWVGCGYKQKNYPAICGGSDHDNWQVYCPPSLNVAGSYFDTGIPFHDSQNTMPDQVMRAWHTLDISRVNGVFRFFINKRLVRLSGNGLHDVEGIYLPDPLDDVRRYFRTQRPGGLPANEGFYVDYFHIAARRG